MTLPWDEYVCLLDNYLLHYTELMHAYVIFQGLHIPVASDGLNSQSTTPASNNLAMCLCLCLLKTVHLWDAENNNNPNVDSKDKVEKNHSVNLFVFVKKKGKVVSFFPGNCHHSITLYTSLVGSVPEVTGPPMSPLSFIY